MRILIILLSCLACADAFAQARPRQGSAPREDAPRRVEEGHPGRSPDNLRDRRESLRAFRDEMRQQQEQRRDLRDASSRDDRQDNHYEEPRSRYANDDGHNNLRRLSPEDRRRMRQEMRDAFRH
jgi:Sec-independent protein translocase protein TatA